MKLFIISQLTMILLLTSCPNSTDSSEQENEKWTLVWSDEFNVNGLPDPEKWGYDIGGSGWGNDELQYYTDRTVNANIQNGRLIIEARKESFEGNEYTSARLVTRTKGDWLYGRIEVKAKLPAGVGTWPAIWMLSTDWLYGGWPESGEIDIMEHVGYDLGKVHGTIHTEAYNHSIGTQKGAQIFDSTVASDYHLYSIEWEADSIRWFMDDKQYFVFENEHMTYAEWPFNKRFHLLMNIAIGGTWGGAQGVDDSIFPVSMEVDFVRVYEKNEQ